MELIRFVCEVEQWARWPLRSLPTESVIQSELPCDVLLSSGVWPLHVGGCARYVLRTPFTFILSPLGNGAAHFGIHPDKLGVSKYVLSYCL